RKRQPAFAAKIGHGGPDFYQLVVLDRIGGASVPVRTVSIVPAIQHVTGQAAAGVHRIERDCDGWWIQAALFEPQQNLFDDVGLIRLELLRFLGLLGPDLSSTRFL